MSTEAMATFFALLLLGGAVGAIATVFNLDLRSRIAPSAHQIAAIVAVGATVGSLYFSEVADYLPCKLCWYQRIAMYPLALIIPLALHRRDVRVLTYAKILCWIGAAVSAYHVQLQWFPDQSSTCDAFNPCTGRWVEAFGWMTIPQMAGISFLLIIHFITLSQRFSPQELS